MKQVIRLTALAAGITAAALAGSVAASAQSVGHVAAHAHHQGAVFVQTNNPKGNKVIAFRAEANGKLARVGEYATGGRGARTIGKFSDTLASTGSLVYDAHHHLLLGVNAGSNSVYVFAVRGAHLRLTQVLSSGGVFPDSIAVRGDLAYVLNAGGAGSVFGFRMAGGALHAMHSSARSLGLANGSPPLNVNAPAQVGFIAGGNKLAVVTKLSGDDVDTFSVNQHGFLSAAPVRTTTLTAMPFAFVTAPRHLLVVAEGKKSHVSTYQIRPDGKLRPIATLGDGGIALCWIMAARVPGVEYVTNNGTGTVSAYRVSLNGHLSLLTKSGIVAKTSPGPIDMATLAHGSLLYVQGGTGTVDEFGVRGDGTLEHIGTVKGLGFGTEGLASS
jgi:6-phosphogluconolactonase (cycloisomerase 2 family)